MSKGQENNQDSIERPAKDYANLSKFSQLSYGKKFIDSLPCCPTDHVLDMGCGTGGLAEYTAKSKVPEGRVTALDPDKHRIGVAKENFAGVKNLSFHEGKAHEVLRDKQNLYDVIYSNMVLHWIAPEDLRPTFKVVYAAVKPGGVVLHQYGENYPRSKLLLSMMSVLTEEDRRIIDTTFYSVPSEDTDSLISESGFEVVSKDEYSFDSKFNGIDDFFRWGEATFHGKIPFRKRFHDAKVNVGDIVKIEEDGSLLRRTDLIRLVLRKPEYSSE